MVSSGAFWVAISYRLAACFTGIGSTCGIEIYWRSFRHFGNYKYSLRSEENCGQKNDKNGPKIDKNYAKIALFLYIFRICSLKIFAAAEQSHNPVTVCRTDGQKTVRMTRQSL